MKSTPFKANEFSYVSSADDTDREEEREGKGKGHRRCSSSMPLLLVVQSLDLTAALLDSTEMLDGSGFWFEARTGEGFCGFMMVSGGEADSDGGAQIRWRELEVSRWKEEGFAL
ncbi:uncharacterized protein DS421_9g266800 [Arachis hypogaea]|nr:uncharacterized protein DS421_9g266800 [Arachis hypogaea]